MKKFLCMLLVFTIVLTVSGSNFFVSKANNGLTDVITDSNNIVNAKMLDEDSEAVFKEEHELLDEDLASYIANQENAIAYDDEVYAENISLLSPSNITNGIKQFQQYINSNLPMTYLGTALAIDGSCGPATKTAAIKLIQYRLNQLGAGLSIDGGFGSLSQQAFSTYVGSINRYDSGVWVYILQGLLYCHAYDPNGFDGSYGVNGGTGCLNAVNLFKSVNVISEGSSGTVGIETMKCLVWRTPIRIVSDGVYYIKNNYSQKVLHVQNGNISNYTNVYQSTQYTSDGTYRLRQLWKIYYLGNGIYSLRPMHKLNMGLDMTNSNVDIFFIGTTDTMNGVPTYAQWEISSVSGGYVFKYHGDNAKSLSLESDSTNNYANVNVQTYNGETRQIWSLEKLANPPSGVLIHNVSSGLPCVGKQHNYTAAVYSASSINQSVTWSSLTPSLTTVSSSGTVTGIATGTGTIKATFNVNTALSVTKSFSVKSLLIYQTKELYRTDENGNTAEDLLSGDKTYNQISAMNYFSANDLNKSESTWRVEWEDLCTRYSMGILEDVVLNMVDHFMKGTGSNYTNDNLTAEVREHSSTQIYVNNTKSVFQEAISESSGILSKLEYIASNRANSLIRKKFAEKGILQPVYNDTLDNIYGLRICINGLWGNKIEVVSYERNGYNYTCTLRFTLYDHFGLNAMDVVKYGNQLGFRSWYILQHYQYDGRKAEPFLDLCTFDINVSGTI